jgi:hypothetical protein
MAKPIVKSTRSAAFGGATLAGNSPTFMAATLAADVATGAPLAAQPISVAPVLMARQDNLVLANPKLAHQMASIHHHKLAILIYQPPGQPREELQVPVAPAQELTDTLLYEDARDPARKSYLPRYRLREDRGRYEIGVAEAPEGGWRLHVGLERFPAPELGAAAQGASELPHLIAVFFRYNDTMLEHRVEFNERVDDAKGVTVSTRLSTRERDYLLQAMNDLEASPSLVVRRAFTVAVQLANAESVPPGRASMTMMPMRSRPAMMAAFRADRLGISISDIQAEPPPQPEPLPEPPLVPRYQVVEHALEDIADPEPFLLDPRFHGYLYEGLSIGGAQSAARYERIPVEFPPGSQSFHAYLQDRDEPWVFYYLPDRFKLARADLAPFYPMMVERIGWTGGSVANATATVDFVVRPWTNVARLAAAADWLKRNKLPAGATRTEPELRPLPAVKTALELWMPGPAGPVLTRQPDMAIDLANGFMHSFTLPERDLALVRAAACSEDVNTFFTGRVLVDTGLETPESVEVKVRFADTVGPVLLVRQEPPAADGSIAAKLQNAIESPVQLGALPARVRGADGHEVAASVEGIAFSPPLRLAPTEEIAVTIRPAGELAGAASAVVLDLSGVKILADPAAIQETIRDDTVPEQPLREVTVTTFPELLGDPAEETSILLITVEFKDGGKATLTRTKLEQVVPARANAEGNIQFRQQIVRKNNARTVDADWREQFSTDLVVPLD